MINFAGLIITGGGGLMKTLHRFRKNFEKNHLPEQVGRFVHRPFAWQVMVPPPK